jgi:hypothetical protein
MKLRTIRFWLAHSQRKDQQEAISNEANGSSAARARPNTSSTLPDPSIVFNNPLDL